MSQTTELLSQLRDVQQPLPPEGASLWLLAANLSLILLLCLLLIVRYQRRRHGWRKEAFAVIDHARQLDPTNAQLELASLLRRLLRYRLGESVDHLQGHTWLQQLDREFDTHWFTSGQGQVFGDALYQPLSVSQAELNDVCNALQRLLRKLRYRPPVLPA